MVTWHNFIMTRVGNKLKYFNKLEIFFLIILCFLFIFSYSTLIMPPFPPQLSIFLIFLSFHFSLVLSWLLFPNFFFLFFYLSIVQDPFFYLFYLSLFFSFPLFLFCFQIWLWISVLRVCVHVRSWWLAVQVLGTPSMPTLLSMSPLIAPRLLHMSARCRGGMWACVSSGSG